MPCVRTSLQLYSLASLYLQAAALPIRFMDAGINPDDIDRIQVVLAMGNPAYGANSKIITDRGEIQALVEAFNHATLGDRVDFIDVAIAFHSVYYFFGDDTVMHRFVFNANDTERIRLNDNWYWVYYADKTPFELYLESTAPEIVVDEDLIEMERPSE